MALVRDRLAPVTGRVVPLVKQNPVAVVVVAVTAATAAAAITAVALRRNGGNGRHTAA